MQALAVRHVMSEIDMISSLLDKVAKKQRVDTVPQRLDEMLQILDSWEDSGADDVSRAAALASLGSKLEAVGVAQGESSTARELESSVRKLGKAVCKAMPQPTLPDVPLDDGALVQVLYVHMLCAGRFDVALALEREAADAIAAPTLQLRAPLEALHAALSALRARDLSPALAWAADHRERLEALGSRLPFLLARLAFASHLEKGETLAALALARERLLPLALGEGCRSPRGKIELSATVLRGAAAGECAHGIAAVRSLMGSLAFAPALRGSRYEWLLEPSLAEEACEVLTCEALAALGLPCGSALSSCVAAGEAVLPRLVKLSSLLGPKFVDVWRSGGELPVELELPPTHRMHHSIFACPVSKEPTTPGNPPMLLPCGHVLALGSLTKLARGSRTVRFKCPYCPAEATTAMAKVLHL